VPTRRVLALDVPGDAGMSASPTHKPRNPREVARWLEEVLSALALERAVVVGHSYGAWLALTHAIHHPDRLKHLVLVDPTDCFTRPGFPELGNRWSRNRRGRHCAVEFWEWAGGILSRCRRQRRNRTGLSPVGT